jgi:tRNA threonylcarbamoyladenosine biosynthesis protein TsaB
VLALAIDTCDARGSLAVVEGKRVLAVVAHETAEDYSTWLLPAVNRVLQVAGRCFAEIEVYAAAAGPGSFTGIRIALTTVKAWNEVFQRPIAGVSRLEALAIQAVGAGAEGNKGGAGGSVPPRFVVASCDAQRGQLYAAVYRRQAEGLRRLGDERVVGPGELIRWASEEARDDRIAWVSLDTTSLAAEGAWLGRATRGEVLEELQPLVAPAIARIALRLATERKLTDALSLDANYIRRPDAEVKWKGYGRPQPGAVEPSAPRYRVRPFRPADASAAARIAKTSGEAANWLQESYAGMSESGYTAWVAVLTEADAVAGFVIVRAIAPEAEILNLAVDSKFRRCGIATALLAAAQDELGKNGVERAYLEVRSTNSAAISFYKKHLFHATGSRAGYYQNPSDNAILMEKKLIGPTV